MDPNANDGSGDTNSRLASTLNVWHKTHASARDGFLCYSIFCWLQHNHAQPARDITWKDKAQSASAQKSPSSSLLTLITTPKCFLPVSSKAPNGGWFVKTDVGWVSGQQTITIK